MLRCAKRTEGGAIVRLLDAAEDFATDAYLRLKCGDLRNVEELLRVVCCELFAQAIAALRDCADAAPLAVGHLEDLADQFLRREVAGLVEDARVLVLHQCASFLELLDGHQRPFENVQGLESGHNDRRLVARANWDVLAVPHHGAHVTRTEKSLHEVLRRRENCFECRRHQHVRDQQRHVGHLLFAGAPREHRIGRGGGLEANGKEDDLFGRVCTRNLQAVQRRVNDAHIAAFGLDREQVTVRSGHAQHVAKRAEDYIRPPRNGMGLVDHLERRYAYRAAWPVAQLNTLRQKLIEPVLYDGVGLSAADLHQYPWPRLDAPHLRHYLGGDVPVAIFVKVFHCRRSP